MTIVARRLHSRQCCQRSIRILRSGDTRGFGIRVEAETETADMFTRRALISAPLQKFTRVSGKVR
jgi:hypothetical protein